MFTPLHDLVLNLISQLKPEMMIPGMLKSALGFLTHGLSILKIEGPISPICGVSLFFSNQEAAGLSILSRSLSTVLRLERANIFQQVQGHCHNVTLMCYFSVGSCIPDEIVKFHQRTGSPIWGYFIRKSHYIHPGNASSWLQLGRMCFLIAMLVADGLQPQAQSRSIQQIVVSEIRS